MDMRAVQTLAAVIALPSSVRLMQVHARIGATAPMAGFLFLAIMYRELLMDLGDIHGDRLARVWTLPVMIGRGRAFIVGLCLLSMAVGLAASRACFGNGPAKVVSLQEPAVTACVQTCGHASAARGGSCLMHC